MSDVQGQLKTIQQTVADLGTAINELAEQSGQGTVITPCTSFTEYPSILRSINAGYGGIATVFAYRVSDMAPSKPEDSGSFDFTTGEYTVPEDWQKSDEIETQDSDTVWMTQAMFSERSTNSNQLLTAWSTPIRLSTTAVMDDVVIPQHVYLSTASNVAPNTPIADGDNALNSESIGIGWSEIYAGINSEHPYAWISVRKKVDNVWSNYSQPVIYGHWANDGAPGESAELFRSIFAFTETASRETPPVTPTGGFWNVNNNYVELPEGWTLSPEESYGDSVFWMSTATFSSKAVDSPIWSEPVCITGEDGKAGSDGSSTEYIYALVPYVTDLDEVKNYMSAGGYNLERTEKDVVPNFMQGSNIIGRNLTIIRSDETRFNLYLTDDASGIDGENFKCEIYWMRSGAAEGWMDWNGPMYWSTWGEHGMDGNSVEYIFTASNDATCDIPLPIYEDLSPEEAAEFQKDEYCPPGWYDNDDDWGGVSPSVPYIFCSSRRQYYNEEKKAQMWSNFSTPKIWGHWGKDGYSSYTSFAFCVSELDLSKCTVTGGSYQSSLTDLITNDKNGNELAIEWTDGIPRNPELTENVWMITKFFDNSEASNSRAWSGPTKLSDSEHFQVEYNFQNDNVKTKYYPDKTLLSLESFKALFPDKSYTNIEELEKDWREYVYENGYGYWSDQGAGAVYMAIARLVDGVWEDWVVNKIKGEEGTSTQFVYTLTNGTEPANPSPEYLTGEYQSDSYMPSGWFANPQSVSDEMTVCWVSQRVKYEGEWARFSDPAKWAMYAQGNIYLELTNGNISIPCEEDGTVDKDFDSHVTTGFLLYDNGNQIHGAYEAIINDDTDVVITAVLSEKPTKTSSSGFFGDTLYIGQDLLNRFKDDHKLRVECRAIVNAVPYSATFIINKASNAYEIDLAKQILYLDKDLKVKDSLINVRVIKWVEDEFKSVTSGTLDCLYTYYDDTTTSKTEYLDSNGSVNISLSGLKNLKSIQFDFKKSDSNEILDTEIIGTVLDGEDAVSQYTSFVFTRADIDLNSDSYRPVGGTFENPIPDVTNEIQWYGTIPVNNNVSRTLSVWMSYRTFYSNNDSTSTKWSIPVLAADGAGVDFAWSYDAECPQLDPPDDNSDGNGWYNGNSKQEGAIWMAMRSKVNGVWSPWVKTKIAGEKGDAAVSAFVSQCFARTGGSIPDSPQGGSYENPIPDDTTTWYDTVPSPQYDANGLVINPTIWMTKRVFYSDGSHDDTSAETYNVWAEPTSMLDSTTLDIRWSAIETDPGLPDQIGYTQYWVDDETEVSDVVWMAYRKKQTSADLKWSAWTRTRIKGEKGDKGDPGDPGASGSSIANFTSNVYCRTNTDISGLTLSGGSYTNPIPTASTVTWYDGIPAYDKSNPESIWTSHRIFYEDNSQDNADSSHKNSWTSPTKIVESNEWEIWWCDEETDTPGNPDSNPSIWYDADTDSGEESPIDPIWMATRHIVDGSGSWVVTKVKGEAGKDGEDGDDGGIGAMGRTSKWSNEATATSGLDEDAFYQSGAAGEKWYDIVIYNDSRYRCIKSHSASESIAPGTTGSEVYWIAATEFEFVATDLLMSDEILANKIQVDKLISTSANTKVVIMDGILSIYSGSDYNYNPCANIILGLDENGEATLKFYKYNADTGTCQLTWDVGPQGPRDWSVTSQEIAQFTEERVWVLSPEVDTGSEITMQSYLEWLINEAIDIPSTAVRTKLYRYNHYVVKFDQETGNTTKVSLSGDGLLCTDTDYTSLFTGYTVDGMRGSTTNAYGTTYRDIDDTNIDEWRACSNLTLGEECDAASCEICEWLDYLETAYGINYKDLTEAITNESTILYYDRIHVFKDGVEDASEDFYYMN